MGKGLISKYLLFCLIVAAPLLWAGEAPQESKSAATCSRTFKLINVLKYPGKVAQEVGHTLYFPYVKAAQILREGWGISRKEPGRSWSRLANKIWRKDKWRAGIFSALLLLDYQTTVNYREFEVATRGFEQAQPDGQTVVVDSFKADDWLYPKAGRYMHKHRFAQSDAKLLEPETTTSTYVSTDRFMDLFRKNGMIGKLDIYEHNLPGGSPGPSLKKYGLGYKADEKTPYTPNEIFAPRAQVRFNSCFTGNGPEGREFLARFEELFLSKGGTIYASELQITANPVEYLSLRFDTPEPAGWLRTLAQPTRTPLGLWTATEIALNGREWKMEFPVQSRILVHQVLPKERAWAAPELTKQLNGLAEELTIFNAMNYLGQPYKDAIANKFHELPDPLEPHRKLSETHEWKFFSYPFHYALVTPMPTEKAHRFIDAFNSNPFPYLRAREFPASFSPYAEGLHLELKTPPKEELKAQLSKIRKNAEIFLETLGAEGSKEEDAWMLKAKEDAKRRIQAGLLQESEREVFEAQAKRKLIFIRSEGRRIIEDIDDTFKYRASLQ